MRKKKTALAALCLGLFFRVQSGAAADQARITSAQLGLGVTPQFDIVNPSAEFTPDTPKIYCAWKGEGMKSGTPVRGVWIAEDVGKAAPANYKIDQTSFNPLGSKTAGSFALSKPNKGFPVGKYRLEIYVGNDLLKTVPFTIKAK
jgi:hypothetical protein